MDEKTVWPWIRKHDAAGTDLTAPRIFYPQSLDDLITICSNPERMRLKAAGSHWALSTAAISDGDFIDTHDPRDQHDAMGRTLYDVVPGCLHEDYLSDMARRHPAGFGDPPDAPPPVDHAATYLVHVETGKRIYQLYAELDSGDDQNVDMPCGPEPQRNGSLAWYLDQTLGNADYHGPWGFRTLGGAGGQTVFGALTTGTHGGDFNLGPLADDVAAVHLVADGGEHFWIEPVDELPLTDQSRIEAFYSGVNFKRDTELFNAVLVSAGRFGVIYSVVLRAVRQYALREDRVLSTWKNVKEHLGRPSSSLFVTGPNDSNGFLQVVVCLTPEANFTENLAGVTRRWKEIPAPSIDEPNGRKERVGAVLDARNQRIGGPRFEFAGNSIAYSPDHGAPGTAGFLDRACADGDFIEGVIKSAIAEVRQLIDDHTAAASSGLAAVAVVGGEAALLTLISALVIVLALLVAFLATLSAVGGHREGQVLKDLESVLLTRSDPAEQAAGLFIWQLVAYKVFRSKQGPQTYNALSYAVMDQHNYLDRSCEVNGDSIEVFFNARSEDGTATNPMLVAFIESLIAFEISQEVHGRAFVGYASLRFTARSRALLAPERWPLTCVVEVAGLRDVTGSVDLINFAMKLARDPNFGAILHWGQRNDASTDDTQRAFGDPTDPHNGNLGRWREQLSAVTNNGGLDAFSSAFTRQTGLEVT